MLSKICLLGALLFSTMLFGQEINIIPKPVSLEKIQGPAFTISGSTQIVIPNESLKPSADYLNMYIKQVYGFVLPVSNSPRLVNAIIIHGDDGNEEKLGKYTMSVMKDHIEINAENKKGAFYAVQTLIQLLPIDKKAKTFPIPQLRIEDYPRFAYRGMHLDVARHFFPVSFVKKYIDFLAVHKMNYFHWHLTEDQGWRIEIKKYPKLTTIGGYRNGTIIGRYPGTGNDNIRYGGSYSQKEIKEVVDHAALRYITVVPEIELPGHGSAAIAAYPWLSCFPDQPTTISGPHVSIESQKSKKKLVQETWGVFDDVFCAGKDSTFKFLEDVMDEVMALFPSKYIHVGGDECPKTHWKKCPHCQKRIKDLKLHDEHELQSYFIQRMEKYLNAKGRTLIGWDEILEGGLAPKAVVMSWRGEEGGIAAAKEKHDVIMTPGSHVYFDHTQSLSEDSVTIGGFSPVEKVYSYEPIPKELKESEHKYVLGAQANVWTEYMKNTKKVEYMIFPRMAALSEVLWSPRETNRNWQSFEPRFLAQLKRYDMWAFNYSKAYFNLNAKVLPSPDQKGLLVQFETKDKKAALRTKTHAGGNAITIKPMDGITYSGPVKVSSSNTVSGWSVVKGVTVGQPINVDLLFNKATGKKISLTTEPAKNYPGDGAFTLVNGVQNTKGMARSREIVGWSGDDLEAVIDLGSSQSISSAVIHSLSSGGSWVYPPKYAEIFISNDGKSFTSVGKSDKFEIVKGINGVIKINFSPVSTRYVKVLVKNLGMIPDDKPGAGNKPWLFVDEIEIN